MSIFFRLNIALYGLILGTSTMLIAQFPASELAMDKACRCLEKHDLINLSGSALETVGDSCLEAAFWGHISGLMKEFDIESYDSLFLVAKKIGSQLATNCSAYKYYAHRVARGDLKEQDGDREYLDGILLSIQYHTNPPSLMVLDSQGVTHRFYWLREFDGSARFFGDIDAFEFTEFRVVWKMVELFDPASLSYKEHSEIILMEEIKILTKEEKERRYLSQKAVPKKKKKQRKADKN